MKTCFFLLLFLCNLVYGQTKENVYFYFDTKSTDKWISYGEVPPRPEELKEYERKHTVNIYRKYKDKKGKIHFTIYGLSFIHDKKMEKAIKSIDFLKNHKVLSANQTKQFIEEMTRPKMISKDVVKAPLYTIGGKGFPKLYIAEKKDSARVVLYKVRWQYYIE